MTMRYLLTLAALLLLIGCDSASPGSNDPVSLDPETDEEISIMASAYDPGDRVVMIEVATVYANPQTPLGQVPEGSLGTVLREREKNGVTWVEVDFDDPSLLDGFVDSMLSAAAIDPPPPPPPPPPHPVGGVMIGGLGCSMTRDLMDPGVTHFTAMDAWMKVGPDGETVTKQFSGGTIARWAEGLNNKWGAFETAAQLWPPSLIVWQICTQESEAGEPLESWDEGLHYIYDRMVQTVGAEVPIYVTGLPTYEEAWHCTITGSTGVPYSHELAARAAQLTGATLMEGLVLGPFGADEIKTGDSTACHVSMAGAELEALQLHAWLQGSIGEALDFEVWLNSR